MSTATFSVLITLKNGKAIRLQNKPEDTPTTMVAYVTQTIKREGAGIFTCPKTGAFHIIPEQLIDFVTIEPEKPLLSVGYVPEQMALVGSAIDNLNAVTKGIDMESLEYQQIRNIQNQLANLRRDWNLDQQMKHTGSTGDGAQT